MKYFFSFFFVSEKSHHAELGATWQTLILAKFEVIYVICWPNTAGIFDYTLIWHSAIPLNYI